jgi:glycosyltransferase involved in cell wall biosynthesis
VVFTSHTRYDLYARYYLPFAPPGVAEALMARALRRASRGFDLVIAVSAAAEAMLRAMRVEAPIEVIPNGIDLQPFAAAAPAARAALGLPAEAFVAMYVGRLGPEKNLPVLLPAFARAAAEVPEMVLALVGGGPLEGALRRQAGALGVAGRVFFLGRQPNDVLPALLRAADAFVTASVSEGHPITLIEALAAGRPVAAFDAPGIRETVRDGESGLLAAPEAAALGAALARLAREPELRRRLGEGARQAAAQYDIRVTSARILKHYEALRQAKAQHRSGRAATDRGAGPGG